MTPCPGRPRPPRGPRPPCGPRRPGPPGPGRREPRPRGACARHRGGAPFRAPGRRAPQLPNGMGQVLGDPVPHPSGRLRGRPCRGHGHGEPPAAHHGRHMEVASPGVIGRVDPHPPDTGLPHGGPVHAGVGGGNESKDRSLHVPGLEPPGYPARLCPVDVPAEFRADLGRHHGHPGAGPEQPGHLAGGHGTAAHHEHRPALEVEEHGVALTHGPPRPGPPPGTRAPGRSG